jgi:Raf kinase inhibitor-like YbhB/YbcL family protein
MNRSAFLIAATCCWAIGGAASARVRADNSGLALDRVLSPAVQPLVATSPAAEPGQTIPAAYTALGKNVSPPVAWESGPPGTASYVVIMEDADGPGSTPVLHWMAYNIPATVNGLGKNVHNRATPKGSTGMMQGINYAGGVGYVGPKVLPGDPPHHYHIEVFALDRMLNIGPGASLDKLIAAMNQRVLAEGEVIGTFAVEPLKTASN